jgi:hypothetical protein
MRIKIIIQYKFLCLSPRSRSAVDIACEQLDIVRCLQMGNKRKSEFEFDTQKRELCKRYCAVGFRRFYVLSLSLRLLH